jgi:hypothetical protein
LTGCGHLSEATTEETAAATVTMAAMIEAAVVKMAKMAETIEAAAVKMAKTAEADIRKRWRQW